MSIIHFNGKFNFHMPGYNNIPQNQKIPFDPNPQRDKVYEVCGCDPTYYYDFFFNNVTVNRITYNDGTICSTDSGNDSILGRTIQLNAIMPDVSPSAVCAQLFSANIKIGNLLSGKLQKAIQSDLRVNLRPLNSEILWNPESAGAHFETILEISDKSSPIESRFLKEIENESKLEFYMHLNRYTYWNTRQGRMQDRLSGDVYGYIRPIILYEDVKRLRLKGRRIITDKELINTSSIKDIFLGKKFPLTRNEDIDGTYDIVKKENLLTLRCLDFIPLLDRCYNTPTDIGLIKEYILYFKNSNKTNNNIIEIGRFDGNYDELKNNGGLFVFPIKDKFAYMVDEGTLLIRVKDKNDKVIPLMKESDVDIVLKSERGLTLESDDTSEVIVQVYHMNTPYRDCQVRLFDQPDGKHQNDDNEDIRNLINTDSPIVAHWVDNMKSSKQDDEDYITISTDNDGKISATIKSINLENTSNVFDPVTNQDISGDLPWDRYYGNYMYMEIYNESRIFQSPSVERIEISVRVLHAIKSSNLPSHPTFTKDISKLFSYYLRYFPWLHTNENDIPMEVPMPYEKRQIYIPFLDLENYDQIRDGNTLKEIIRRLELDNDQHDKMPRSRDFPFGGLDLIKRWMDQGSPK
jgi:hypothetical protein